MLHTLAWWRCGVAAVILAIAALVSNEDFTNIGLVLDMSNGTSEEEYDEEEEED